MTARSDPPRAGIHPDRGRSWLGRARPLLRAHRGLLVASLAAALVALVLQVLIPLVTMRAIDQALVARTAPLAPYIWLFVGIGVTRAVLTYFYRAGLYRMAYEIEFDLRAIVYGHLTRLSFSFFDRVQSGQLISRANADIRSVQLFLTFAPLMALSLVSFAVALVLMLTINVGLTLLSVVTLPFVYVAGLRLRNQVFPLSWVVQARTAEVATIVEENVSGARVVKSFAAEERQIGLLARAAQRLRWANVRLADARARWAPVMENLPRLGLAAVLLYGGWLVIDGQLEVGAIVAFNAYVVMLQTPFRFLGFLLMLQQRAAASADRIYEILDEAPEIQDRPGAVDLVDPVGDVELRDVRFAYATPGRGQGGDESTAVLDGFSLHLRPGETVALVGGTGSGKSTAARLLLRFYDVDAGAVLVDGHDVRDLTTASLRALVGLVADEPFLFSCSIAENIAYARPDATRDQIVAGAVAAQADAFIRELPDGYDTVIGERGYDLSGGQRQRLSIARALVADPRVLVLDDATSAVDVQVEAEIHRALHTLLAGRTTLLVAHRLSTIALADRVALVESGRVVAEGTHTELLAREPRYAAVLAHLVDADATPPTGAGEPAVPEPTLAGGGD
ncbi:MAG: ABC transporter ATP-binding protein [Acidimicrobiales bacterium]|nr:ABC transporter ATP-binding protein [Acidimicrobiales bacterium]